VMNDLGWSIQSASQAVLTQSVALFHVRFAARSPFWAEVKCFCEIFHSDKPQKRKPGVSPSLRLKKERLSL